MAAKQWSKEKLATINDAALWDVNREKPCRVVGCRVCPVPILKNTDAVRVHPKAGNKEVHDGFIHLDCALSVCAEAIARYDARMEKYRQDYAREVIKEFM